MDALDQARESVPRITAHADRATAMAVLAVAEELRGLRTQLDRLTEGPTFLEQPEPQLGGGYLRVDVGRVA